MYGKCRILRFKITVFGVMGPCYGWWVTRFRSGHTASIFWQPVKTGPQCSSKTFITMYQTIWYPNPEHIMNPHHCEHFKSCIRNVKNNWRVDGNVTLGKLNYRTAGCFFTDTLFNITYFSANCVQCFIFCLSNMLRKQDMKYFRVTDIISIYTHFRIRTT
jgi:hypothetical protein